MIVKDETLKELGPHPSFSDIKFDRVSAQLNVQALDSEPF